jgi:ribosomal protein L37E
MSAMDVLMVDKGGNPRDWLNYQDTVKAYAEDRVICNLGTPVRTYVGGRNSTGELSKIEISSIVMVTGPVMGETFKFRVTKYCEREILYARDAFMCAYCGIRHLDKRAVEEYLTIDHVMPRSRGGDHTWTNTVTSCSACNHGKADRTPEEAGMQLLYVPYAPNLQEKLLLKNRKVKADQMDYLLATIPRSSRVHQNAHYLRQ